MKSENDFYIIISCEHRGNQVPTDFVHLFKDEPEILETHEGYDIGVIEVYNSFKKKVKGEVFFNDISRLLIEVNRSINHPQLYSKFVSEESETIKNFLLNTYYIPYRTSVEKYIEGKIKSKKILHLSLHTFTPVLAGKRRKVDIGLLCDESNKIEYQFCRKWQMVLQKLLPGFVTLINSPYNGADDGFTTYLRTRFTSGYLGIEIEVNQRYAGGKGIGIIAQGLIDGLYQIMKYPQPIHSRKPY